MPIGKNNAVRPGDYAHECAVCGVNWLRSELRRNAEFFLICPDCWGGRTKKELDEMRAPLPATRFQRYAP